MNKYYFTLCTLLLLISGSNGFSSEEKRVYLATYPRSGNHWLRSLVEESSGIFTFGVYRKNKFPVYQPWGFKDDHRRDYECRLPLTRERALVKTHFPVLTATPFDHRPYFKVITIVRNPVDSIYSYYVLMCKQKKTPLSPTIPRRELEGYIEKYRRMLKHWGKQPNVVTLKYEEMLLDPHSNLKMVLNILGYKVSDEAIDRAISKYPPIGKPFKHIEHFSRGDLNLIERQLHDLMEKYGYTIPRE